MALHWSSTNQCIYALHALQGEAYNYSGGGCPVFEALITAMTRRNAAAAAAAHTEAAIAHMAADAAQTAAAAAHAEAASAREGAEAAGGAAQQTARELVHTQQRLRRAEQQLQELAQEVTTLRKRKARDGEGAADEEPGAKRTPATASRFRVRCGAGCEWEAEVWHCLKVMLLSWLLKCPSSFSCAASLPVPNDHLRLLPSLCTGHAGGAGGGSAGPQPRSRTLAAGKLPAQHHSGRGEPPAERQCGLQAGHARQPALARGGGGGCRVARPAGGSGGLCGSAGRCWRQRGRQCDV